MNIQLLKIPFREKGQLASMLLDYFREIDATKIILTPRGEELDYPYLHNYWEDENRIPLKVLIKGETIGFVLINDWVLAKELNPKMSIAEFYIKPTHRRKGIGKEVAFTIFKKYKTTWEIRQSVTNVGAQKFWNATIHQYTNGVFFAAKKSNTNETIFIQVFES